MKDEWEMVRVWGGREHIRHVWQGDMGKGHLVGVGNTVVTICIYDQNTTPAGVKIITDISQFPLAYLLCFRD